jgi:hypothetical protein
MNAEGSNVEALNGQRLSSVSFVEDYIQLGFDRAGLNIINTPTVLVAGAPHRGDDPEAASTLVSLIGRVVERVRLEPGQRFTIEFRGGDALWVSLEPADYKRGPEALTIRYDDNSLEVL